MDIVVGITDVTTDIVKSAVNIPPPTPAILLPPQSPSPIPRVQGPPTAAQHYPALETVRFPLYKPDPPHSLPLLPAKHV